MRRLEQLHKLAYLHGYVILVSNAPSHMDSPTLYDDMYHLLRKNPSAPDASGYEYVGKHPRGTVSEIEQKLIKYITMELE